MQFRSTFLIALATLPGAACSGVFDNGCGYESRAVAARAQISAPANPVEYADLSLSQARGDVPWAAMDSPFATPVRTIGWLVIGVDLQAHILGARLVDARPGGGTLLELPKQPIIGGTAALAGDLPGRELIRQTFEVTGGGRAWSEPSCS
jgi:hypothetical protein